MKTLTITLAVTEGVSMPSQSFGAFAGFKLTLTRVSSGGSLTPPVENKLVWQFADMVEGQSYTLLMQCVDEAGIVIMGLPEATITVPQAATYTRLDGFSLAWD